MFIYVIYIYICYIYIYVIYIYVIYIYMCKFYVYVYLYALCFFQLERTVTTLGSRGESASFRIKLESS